MGRLRGFLVVGLLLGTVPGSDGRLEPAGAQPFSGVPASARVVTLLDYFSVGKSEVERFIETSPDLQGETLRTVIDRSRRLCARLEIRLGVPGEVSRTIIGSGVFMDGGRRLLTAGHFLENRQNVDIRVAWPNGRTYEARVSDIMYHSGEIPGQDWAILEVLGSPPGPVASTVTARARETELAIVLGYPDQIGIGIGGHISHSSGLEKELEPLVTLGTIERADPLTLVPRAGAIPTAGMSGAPVFDGRGRLLGIFAAISRRGDRYTYHVTPVDGLRELVDRESPVSRPAQRPR